MVLVNITSPKPLHFYQLQNPSALNLCVIFITFSSNKKSPLEHIRPLSHSSTSLTSDYYTTNFVNILVIVTSTIFSSIVLQLYCRRSSSQNSALPPLTSLCLMPYPDSLYQFPFCLLSSCSQPFSFRFRQ